MTDHERALEAAARALARRDGTASNVFERPDLKRYTEYARAAVTAYLAALPPPPGAKP